jgi:predicted RNase H-like nuclease (RuvC/YqgF family)
MALGGGMAITHYGIKEIEEAYSEPDKPTEHFLPINQYNISIGVMNGGAIQQATNGSTINYTTSNEILRSISDFTNELKQFVENSNLSNDKVEELQIDIQTLELQTNSNKPKTEILKTSLNSIKNIIEGTISGVATNFISSNSELIVNKVIHLLSILSS